MSIDSILKSLFTYLFFLGILYFANFVTDAHVRHSMLWFLTLVLGFTVNLIRIDITTEINDKI